MTAPSTEWRRRNVVAARRAVNDLAARKNKYLRDLKLERGCSDCRYREHAVVLEFDHLPGFTKSFNLSNAAHHGWDDIYLEVEKCEVVCSNCHRIRTMTRKDVSDGG